jgi:hypothetical protein
VTRHDCRSGLPAAAVEGSVAQCPACEAWWQYLVTEHELGSNRRWRRVRWWMLFARHAVEQERTRRAIYEARLGHEQDRTTEETR